MHICMARPGVVHMSIRRDGSREAFGVQQVERDQSGARERAAFVRRHGRRQWAGALVLAIFRSCRDKDFAHVAALMERSDA